uniref:Uncharacterized protein n=1 Tax=Ascaris lumbricoides TaxID=6252 RepID=A0A9J2PXX7_ASCLU
MNRRIERDGRKKCEVVKDHGAEKEGGHLERGEGAAL